MKAYWESGDMASRIINYGTEIEVSCQLHSPAALTPVPI
jgi:hypothetical protein